MFFEGMRRFVVAMAGAASIATEAAPPTFQITSLFSNLDGSVQFIRLTEVAGLDGQHRFAGLTLSMTHGGVIKKFVFAHDLPSENTAHTSIVVVAGTLPLQAGLNEACCAVADYEMPQRFLAIDGGTIDFAGMDRLSYAKLPTGGSQALLRDGTVAPAELPISACPDLLRFDCRTAERIQAAETTVRAAEYHNAVLDHYFITASAADLEALDSGRIRGWQRTGSTFAVGATSFVSINWNVWDLPIPPAFPMQPVCRFYLPPESGDSHFLSASASECAEVHARYPHFELESSAVFYAVLPDLATGGCPQGVGFFLAPMFRLWNARADTNHRYTMDPSVRSAMIAQGWVSESYGPAGVAFCVPLGI
jgi:hypothetical protein